MTEETTSGILTGRKIVRRGGHGWEQSADNLIHGVEVETEYGLYRYAAVEVAGIFHARPMVQNESDPEKFNATDIHHHTRVTVYQPIDPSMTIEDVEGAVWPYDNGTAWTFSHESPAMRHQAEAVAQVLVIAHFQPLINKQGAEIHAAGDITERTLRHNVLLAQNLFVDAVLDEISDSIRAFPLGHFARNTPHSDNHRALVVEALRSVLASWQKRAKRDTEVRHNVNRIKAQVNGLVTSLTEAPKIQTRAEAYEAARPKIARQIETVRMVADGAPNGIELGNKFSGEGPFVYTALSSDEAVATAAVNRSMLTLTPGEAGSATITVKATAPDERHVTMSFTVTVLAQ